MSLIDRRIRWMRRCRVSIVARLLSVPNFFLPSFFLMSEAELFLSFFSFGPADALGSFFFPSPASTVFFFVVGLVTEFFFKVTEFPMFMQPTREDRPRSSR